MINVNHSYAGLWQLYSQVQMSKIQSINPVELFNSRLQDKFLHVELKEACITGIYSRNGNTITIPEREIIDAITDAVNFNNVTCPGGWPTDLLERFEVFTATLPPVSPERAIPLEAEDNYITFKNGNYYRTVGSDGKTRVLACSGYRPSECLTDIRAGRIDSETADISSFWRTMTEGGPYSKLSWSKQVSYLEAAGVEPGFFTVDTDYGEWEYYFNPDSQCPIMRRDEYDITWNAFHCESWHYEPSDILRSKDGREFIVNTDGKIDVEYGDELIGLYPMKIIGSINNT